MTLVIASVSLFVSLLLLVVHYKNQVERRHGEITNLRAECHRRLSLIQQRLTSNLLHAETARLELRTMVDSDDKFTGIEKMPILIQKIKDVSEDEKRLIDKNEAIDPRKQNRTNVLLTLQSILPDIKKLENDLSAAENEILSMLEHIRSHQKPE
jgi:hypothetical protein